MRSNVEVEAGGSWDSTGGTSNGGSGGGRGTGGPSEGAEAARVYRRRLMGMRRAQRRLAIDGRGTSGTLRAHTLAPGTGAARRPTIRCPYPKAKPNRLHRSQPLRRVIPKVPYQDASVVVPMRSTVTLWYDGWRAQDPHGYEGCQRRDRKTQVRTAPRSNECCVPHPNT